MQNKNAKGLLVALVVMACLFTAALIGVIVLAVRNKKSDLSGVDSAWTVQLSVCDAEGGCGRGKQEVDFVCPRGKRCSALKPMSTSIPCVATEGCSWQTEPRKAVNLSKNS